MFKMLLGFILLSFAMAVPASAADVPAGKVPVFGKVEDGVYRHIGNIEPKGKSGLHILYCVTDNGTEAQCVALVEDDGTLFLLVSNPMALTTQAAN